MNARKRRTTRRGPEQERPYGYLEGPFSKPRFAALNMKSLRQIFRNTEARKQGQAGNPKTQAKRILAEWKLAGFPRPPPRTVRAPDIALPPHVPALHRTVRAPAPCPRPPPRTVRARAPAPCPRRRYRAPAPCRPPPRTRYRAPRPLSPTPPSTAHRPGSRPLSTPSTAHPISRSRPLSTPFTGHPISRSRPLSPPSTAHRPRTRYRAPAPCPRAPDIALPPLVPETALRPRPPLRTVRAPAPCPHLPPRTVRAPGLALPPLVPPSTAHHARTRFRAPAPCPRPPPRTVRAPDIALPPPCNPCPPPRTVRAPDIALLPLVHALTPYTHTRTVRAPDIKARAPFSLLKLFRQDTARYRAPRVGALNENPTPEGFSGKHSAKTST